MVVCWGCVGGDNGGGGQKVVTTMLCYKGFQLRGGDGSGGGHGSEGINGGNNVLKPWENSAIY